MRTGIACTTQLVFFFCNGALPSQQHGLLVGGRTYAILNYINSINSRIIRGLLLFLLLLLLLLLLLYAVLQCFTRQFCSSYEGWNFNNGNYLFTTDTK